MVDLLDQEGLCSFLSFLFLFIYYFFNYFNFLFFRFIFRFDNNNNINVTKGKKITPGISSFIDHPEDLWSYFSPVFDDAITIVPKEYHSTTQVFILGTAGIIIIHYYCHYYHYYYYFLNDLIFRNEITFR